jgi:hypothetical protein
LRQQGIELERRHSWCISTDPEFARKAADIVGLYLNPPLHALIFAIDEKPAIQALERAQGWIRLPNGKALTGFSHEYKRHGTSTLFAALNIASGQIQAGHYRRRRCREFLEFMNRVLAGTTHEVPIREDMTRALAKVFNRPQPSTGETFSSLFTNAPAAVALLRCLATDSLAGNTAKAIAYRRRAWSRLWTNW